MSTEHEGDGRPSGEGQTDETAPADRAAGATPQDTPPAPTTDARTEADRSAEASSDSSDGSTPTHPGTGEPSGGAEGAGDRRSQPTAQLRQLNPHEPPPGARPAGGPAPSLAKPGEGAAPPPPLAPPPAPARQHPAPTAPGHAQPAPGAAPAGGPPAGNQAAGNAMAGNAMAGGGTYGGAGGSYGGASGAYGGGGGSYAGGPYAGASGAHGGSYGGGTGEFWGAPTPPAPKRKGRGVLLAAVLAAALFAGGIGGGVGYWAADRSSSSSETVAAPGNAGDRSAASVAGIASKALPSVVTIQLNGGTGNRGGGTGTGFVFDKQGHILTNNHVVAAGDGDAKLTVVFSDGEKYDAEIVGRAEGYDVAVIKLSNPGEANLTPLPLGKSGDVAVGDSTVAIGAPFGLSGTVTTGIVSALKRPVASSDGEGSAASYMSALQTDASINPGNSGGPLLNDAGAVIGVNSAIQSTGDGMGGSAGSIGLGFAIPIDQAKRVAQNLIETGEPVYPIIGASVNMRGQGNGAEVVDEADDGTDSVIPGGPAAKAGLRGGDVITKLNDTHIDSGPTLISEIWTYEPGDKVKITYERGGEEATTDVTLGKRTGD